MNCNDAMAALVASLENGTTLTDEQREHLRTCPRCRLMLSSARAVLRIEPHDVLVIDGAVAAAEKEVRRKHVRRSIRSYVGVTLLLAVAAVAILVLWGGLPLHLANILAGIGAGVLLLLVGPVLLFIWYVRGAAGVKHRLYRRLGPPRMLSGVCAGLSEAWRMDVVMLRIIFVLLFLFSGAGFWLYLLCILVMPVHPDDRQYLLRFKLRRWWRRTMHAEQRAG